VPAYVYLLSCADGTLYCGWSTDPDRRLRQHQAGTASRYTRRRRPVELVWSAECADRSDALRVEARIKRLTRAEKRVLVGAEVLSRPMGNVSGDRSVEIDAPIERVFEIAADIQNSPEWQGSLKDVEVLEKDADKRASVVETESDAKVKRVKARLRFSYDEPTGIEWVQEKGDTKALRGWWTFEDLGDGRTRATYGLDVDPGRMLGMLLRGPVEGQVRNFLLGGAAEGLKEKAESG
jgi:predicted GIY-YIG superfamily endonuclease/ribosome-associated toxin RatA of RatAB toxin-antitoxin module